MDICITLLCTWKIVSQLCFNKIYIKKKKLVKNQRLVATKSCAKTSNHLHPAVLGHKCSALLATLWAMSRSPVPLANQRKRWEESRKKVKGQEEGTQEQRAGSYMVGVDPWDVGYSPPHWPRVPWETQTPEKARDVMRAPSNWVVQKADGGRTVYFPHPQERPPRAG